MPKKSKDNCIFWDYDLAKANLTDPKIKLWYLNRKLQFGSLSGLKKSDLKKNLPKLDISPSLKELLKNFLSQYA